MGQRVQVGGLSVADSLHRFVEEEATARLGRRVRRPSGTGSDAIVHDLAPRNRELLARRDELQSRIDDWHREHPGTPDAATYTDFLREIGYLLDEPAEVAATTADVDDEVARIAGPQLVGTPAQRAVRHQRRRTPAGVPSTTRSTAPTWSPREGDLAPGEGYNKVRGDEVIARGRALLDEHFPLGSGLARRRLVVRRRR